ncbi:hypothetical protein [Poriferisphaera sp. WC338]|uniref:hypothetical protein n=1 Tax=Poriferisphaera sp. WC338 TaxID=3425129 RepID=UPI003D818446
MKRRIKKIKKAVLPVLGGTVMILGVGKGQRAEAASVERSDDSTLYNIANEEGWNYETLRVANRYGYTAGWQFTVNDPDVYVTQLGANTGTVTANDVIQLWDTQNNTLLAEVSPESQDGVNWQFYDLDDAIALEAGRSYAVTASASTGAEWGRINNPTYRANDVRNPDGIIDFDTVLWAYDNDPTYGDLGALGNVQQYFIADFGYTIGVPDGFKNLSIEDAEAQGIAVPTPGSAVMGVAGLAALMLRRRKQDE